MPELLREMEVRLERRDLLNRIALPRKVDARGFIVPPSRAPGLHLSGLLKYIACKSRITERIKEVEEEELPGRFLFGLAMEEYLASFYGDMVWQPYEQQDPVIMNCDGIGTDDCGGPPETPPEIVIAEFKAGRFKRIEGRKILAKWLWMSQGMGECIGYGANLVEWHVFALMEWPDPTYTRYLVRFSGEDLHGMQQMINANKAAAIAAGYAEGTP